MSSRASRTIKDPLIPYLKYCIFSLLLSRKKNDHGFFVKKLSFHHNRKGMSRSCLLTCWLVSCTPNLTNQQELSCSRDAAVSKIVCTCGWILRKTVCWDQFFFYFWSPFVDVGSMLWGSVLLPPHSHLRTYKFSLNFSRSEFWISISSSVHTTRPTDKEK